MRVVRQRGLAELREVPIQRALRIHLMRVPQQAEVEVNLLHALPLHLLSDGLLIDPPAQAALRDFGPDGARQGRLFGGRVGLRLRRGVLPPRRGSLPDLFAHDLLVREARAQVPNNQTQCPLPVVLEVHDQVPELPRVDQGLAVVDPLALRQGLRQLVRDDAMQHQVVQAEGKSFAYNLAEVFGNLVRRRVRHGRGPRPDDSLVNMQDGGALDDDLANAIALQVLPLHLLRREKLHPARERRLLHRRHCRIEVETQGARCGLEMAKIKVRVRSATLRTGQHASIHELVHRQLPLVEHDLKVDPVEGGVLEGDSDDDPRNVVQQQARRPDDRVNHAVLREVRQLGASEVGRAEDLAATLLQIVEHEEHEVAVDAAGVHRKTFLSLVSIALCQMGPCDIHLLIDPRDKHRVLRARGHTLEDEHRRNGASAESLQLSIDECESPRRHPAERIRKRILQGLN
mmetsp:Transcript_100064/g.288939  ORF Transcript_100064/g.288939 Transcript_100064/m.288939 type:complete len:458 (+) Transcript_100064:907-2280(+)